MNNVTLIRDELKEFLKDYPEVAVLALPGYKKATSEQYYTQSPWYLLYTTEFHDDPNVSNFINMITSRTLTGTTFVDVGCGSGMTGLLIALQGFAVTFHDYESLGMDFIRGFIARHGLSASVIPYGEEVPRHTVAIALDVLEHTSSHVSTLRWLRELGINVALTYPLLPYRRPYIREVDEYVDDEAMMLVANQRYNVVFATIHNKRRFLIYRDEVADTPVRGIP